MFNKKLKFPGRTVLRIESYKKKFFFFIVHDFLNIYLSNFMVRYKNNTKNILITQEIMTDNNNEYPKNNPKNIAKIKKDINNILFSSTLCLNNVSL